MKTYTLEEVYNEKIKSLKEAAEHSQPSPETLNKLENMSDRQDLIIEMIKEFKADFKTYVKDNQGQHKSIIERQDKTNGSVAKIKKGQLILWTVFATVFGVLAVLGFIPERLFNIISGIF